MKRRKRLLIFVMALILGLLMWAWATQVVYSQNKENHLLTINTPVTSRQLDSIILSELGIKTTPTVSYFAIKSGFAINEKGVTNILVRPKTSFWNLIKLMYRYQKDQITVTIHGSWHLDQLDKRMCEKFNWSRHEFHKLLISQKNLNKYNTQTYTQGELDTLNWQLLFIPNSYAFKRKTSPEQFLDRMATSAHDFWTKERQLAGQKLGLTPNDIVILASIVTKESNKIAEYGKIASTYKNRLKKGMLLQADPTVVFARGYAGRVLLKDTEIESPYNTYKHKGLPIGALCIPDQKAIDSCLFGDVYPYLYFCAKSDLTPQHDFAITLDEHNKNAQRYHRALNVYLKSKR